MHYKNIGKKPVWGHYPLAVFIIRQADLEKIIHT